MKTKMAVTTATKTQPKKEADKKARRSDSRAGAAYYTALILDDEFRIRTFGDAATDLFGFEKDNIVGEHINVLLPSLGRKLKKIPAVDKEKFSMRGLKMQAVRSDGDEFRVEVGMRQDNNYGNNQHIVLVRKLGDEQAGI